MTINDLTPFSPTIQLAVVGDLTYLVDMPRRTDNPAHRLVRAMEPTEKAYFKKYGFKREGTMATAQRRLFDLLDDMDAFDRTRIEADQRLPETVRRDPSSALSKLFARLRRVLVDYRRETSITARVLDGILEHDVLRTKGLHDLADKHINGLKNLAEDHHLYDLKPLVHGRESPFLRNNSTVTAERIDRQQRALERSLNELRAVVEANRLGFRIERLLHDNAGVVMTDPSTRSSAEAIRRDALAYLELPDLPFLFRSVVMNHLLILDMMTGDLDEDLALDFLDRYDAGIETIRTQNALQDVRSLVRNLAIIGLYLGRREVLHTAIDRLGHIGVRLSDPDHVEAHRLRMLHLRLMRSCIGGEDLDPDPYPVALDAWNRVPTGSALSLELLLGLALEGLRRGDEATVLDLLAPVLETARTERVLSEVLSLRMLRAIAWWRAGEPSLFRRETDALQRLLRKHPGQTIHSRLVKLVKRLTDHPDPASIDVSSPFRDILRSGAGTERMKAVEAIAIARLLTHQP